MNNPEALPLDIAEQRAWLLAHKAETGMSWSALAPKVGIPMGTLSPFAVDSYQGKLQPIAEAIYRYRQLLTSQAEIAIEMPEPPAYFETPTGRRVMTMLSIAQRGRITVVAGGPGTSKTTTLRHYQASVSNVWIATMKPSTNGTSQPGSWQHEGASKGSRFRRPSPAFVDRVLPRGGHDLRQHPHVHRVVAMRAYRADTLSVQRIHAARQAALSISEIRAARAAPAPRAARVVPAVAPSAPPKMPPPTTRAIIDFVAYQTGLSGAAIIGRDREPRLVRARAAVSWIARAVAGRSTAQIGAVLGGRDYSSIGGQHRHAERLLDSDPAFKLLIERAIAHFSEGNPA